MASVFDHPEHVATWVSALDGNPPQWADFYSGYTAAVDWPASIFWPQLAEAFPDAPILLSKRADGATWYRSMSNTILWARDTGRIQDTAQFNEMFTKMWKTVLGDLEYKDKAGCVAAYDAYVAKVRDTAPADRLIEWEAREGWEPLCAKLGIDVPDQPFPYINTTAQFQEMVATRMGPMSPDKS